MSRKPYDRELLNQRERPLTGDLNTQFSLQDYTQRWAMLQTLRRRTSSSSPVPQTENGFLGGGFRVVAEAPASMVVRVNPGLGFKSTAIDPATDYDIGSALTPGLSGVDDLSYYRPLVLESNVAFNVPAADPGNARVDIVEVKVDRRLTDSDLRAILDPVTGTFAPVNVPKTLSWAMDDDTEVNTSGGDSTAGLAYKTGTPGVGPVAPATSAGYIKIAEVNVAAGAASLAQDRIRDTRVLLGRDGLIDISLFVRRAAGVLSVDVMAPPGIQAGARTILDPGNIPSIVQVDVLVGDGSWKAAAATTSESATVVGSGILTISAVSSRPTIAQAQAVDSVAWGNGTYVPPIYAYGGITGGQQYITTEITLLECDTSVSPATYSTVGTYAFWLHLRLQRT